MIDNILFFVFVICALYITEMVIKLTSAIKGNYEMEVSKLEKILIYVSIGYVITSIVSIF